MNTLPSSIESGQIVQCAVQSDIDSSSVYGTASECSEGFLADVETLDPSQRLSAKVDPTFMGLDELSYIERLPSHILSEVSEYLLSAADIASVKNLFTASKTLSKKVDEHSFKMAQAVRESIQGGLLLQVRTSRVPIMQRLRKTYSRFEDHNYSMSVQAILANNDKHPFQSMAIGSLVYQNGYYNAYKNIHDTYLCKEWALTGQLSSRLEEAWMSVDSMSCLESPVVLSTMAELGVNSSRLDESTLVKIVSKDNPSIWSASLKLLSNMKSEPLRTQLITLFIDRLGACRDRDENGRSIAVSALLALSPLPKKGVDAIARAAKMDSSLAVKREAVTALWSLKDQGVFVSDTLAEIMITESHVSIKERARAALMGAKISHTYIDLLVSQMKGALQEDRNDYLDILIRLNIDFELYADYMLEQLMFEYRPKCLEEAVSLISDHPKIIRAIIPLLTDKLSHDEKNIQQRAARGLGAFLSTSRSTIIKIIKAIIPLPTDKLSHDEKNIQQRAARGLGAVLSKSRSPTMELVTANLNLLSLDLSFNTKIFIANALKEHVNAYPVIVETALGTLQKDCCSDGSAQIDEEGRIAQVNAALRILDSVVKPTCKSAEIVMDFAQRGQHAHTQNGQAQHLLKLWSMRSSSVSHWLVNEIDARLKGALPEVPEVPEEVEWLWLELLLIIDPYHPRNIQWACSEAGVYEAVRFLSGLEYQNEEVVKALLKIALNDNDGDFSIRREAVEGMGPISNHLAENIVIPKLIEYVGSEAADKELVDAVLLRLPALDVGGRSIIPFLIEKTKGENGFGSAVESLACFLEKPNVADHLLKLATNNLYGHTVSKECQKRAIEGILSDDFDHPKKFGTLIGFLFSGAFEYLFSFETVVNSHRGLDEDGAILEDVEEDKKLRENIYEALMTELKKRPNVDAYLDESVSAAKEKSADNPLLKIEILDILIKFRFGPETFNCTLDYVIDCAKQDPDPSVRLFAGGHLLELEECHSDNDEVLSRVSEALDYIDEHERNGELSSVLWDYA